jgi:hypothetical protein
MLYGDYHVGFVRGMSLGADGVPKDDAYLGHIEGPVSWGQGADGYVYAATMRSPDALPGVAEQGRLWRAVPLP